MHKAGGEGTQGKGGRKKGGGEGNGGVCVVKAVAVVAGRWWQRGQGVGAGGGVGVWCGVCGRGGGRWASVFEQNFESTFSGAMRLEHEHRHHEEEYPEDEILIILTDIGLHTVNWSSRDDHPEPSR